MEQVLYKLPDGWEWHSVKKLSHNIQYGHTAKAESNGNAKFLRITDIQDGKIDWQGVPTVSLEEKEISKYALNDDDLIFARSGATAGKSILIKNAPKDAVFASYLIRIVPNKKEIIPEYLSYFFLTPAYWEVVGQNAAGAAQPNINGTKLSEFIVPVAPQGEQKRIVEKLDAVLTRIDTAIEHLQESVTLADALFKSTLSSLVCDESKTYEKLSLEELGSFSGGGTPSKSKSEFWNGEILWVTPKDMKSPVITDSELKITKEGVSGSSAKFIPPRSILIVARSGILRHTLPVCINETECTVNQDIKVFIPSERISSEYTQHMLKGYESFILSELVKGGVTVESLKYKDFQNFKFPVPSVEQQKKIVDELSKISQLTIPVKAELVDKIEQLKQLKASILDSAFKGEL
ncbi:type I restriction-modification system specificity subunit [Alteromonas sp. D210916BOD_24]|uniref:restriction endonuclease subunit S n=1 Tax=Alteromonas sp. D210916BOD_24 TaxID=3157618 RepID=UPI00399D4FE1